LNWNNNDPVECLLKNDFDPIQHQKRERRGDDAEKDNFRQVNVMLFLLWHATGFYIILQACLNSIIGKKYMYKLCTIKLF